MNSELINEDIEAYSKYAQLIPIKNSNLKKHSHCREPEVKFLVLLETLRQFFISQILRSLPCSLFCKNIIIIIVF